LRLVRAGANPEFWEGVLDGSNIVVRWGTVGDPGRKRTYRHDSRAIAKKKLAEMIAKRRARGFRQAIDSRPPVSYPRNPDLEAAIRADRDDPSTYDVYADWLQQHGSPHGELIALERANADPERIAELISTLGVPSEVEATFEWRWGFWTSLRIANALGEDYDPLSTARRAFAVAPCAILDELRIGNLRWDRNHHDVPAVIALAAEHPWASNLRRLFLGDVGPNIDLAHHAIGDVGRAISTSFPNLISLHLHSGEQPWRQEGETFGISNLDLPSLTTLTIETCSLSSQRLSHLLSARLPSLERLSLWFGSANHGADATIDDLRPLFSGDVLTTVIHLGLRNAEITDDIADALPSSSIAPRLQSLDLSMGTLNDAAALRLADRAAAFESLTELDVDENFLFDATIDRLRDVFRHVVSHDQKAADDDYRYVSVGE
jgi:uncharacterized protein (TIGR02996 family)